MDEVSNSEIFSKFSHDDNRTVAFDIAEGGMGDSAYKNANPNTYSSDSDTLSQVTNAPIEEDLIIVNVVGV